MLETDIQKQCLDWLHLNGVFAWRQNNAGVYHADKGVYVFHGLKGVSDILGILPAHATFEGESVAGHFLAVEVKRPGNVMSDHQREFQKRISENGGIACCVYSLDELIEDLTPILRPAQSRMEFP